MSAIQRFHFSFFKLTDFTGNCSFPTSRTNNPMVTEKFHFKISNVTHDLCHQKYLFNVANKKLKQKRLLPFLYLSFLSKSLPSKWPFLFLSNTSARSWTSKHLFVTFHVSWLPRIFNCTICNYETTITLLINDEMMKC